MTASRRQQGVVLLVVLFFALLLAGSTATFLRRAAVDASIARNRDAAARAEGIARGGVRLAEVLLIEDRRIEQEIGLRSDSLQDVWGRVGEVELPVGPDASLRLRITDEGARLNLNALFSAGQTRDPRTELLLVELFSKAIEEMPGRPEEKLYDPIELARNLIDWIDEDEVRVSGGAEDDPYQRRRPPYRAANRPLLSVDELRLVEGFDGLLVDALRPYVGVFPLTAGAAAADAGERIAAEEETSVEGGGINPNTAPPWVLALLYYGDVTDPRLANEDDVRDVLENREQNVICELGDPCIDLHEVIDRMGAGNPPFPTPTYQSDVFRVVAEARVGEVQRRLEAIIDRSKPSEPVRLAWRWY